MTNSSGLGNGRPRADQLLHVDEVCSRFEVALASGGEPRIEDYLEGEKEETVRGLVLEGLLHAEMEYRARRGETVLLNDYVARFEPYAERVRSVYSRLSVPAPSTGGDAPVGEILPRRLDHFVLVERLGRGGMGVVYKARDEAARRDVALKEMRHKDDARARSRFRREAEVAARLEHENILPVFEVQCPPGGHYYYAMRLVSGGSLMDRIASKEKESLGARETAALMERVARAAHFAHERNVVHRDIKPHNILLDGDGTPFLADFGLAKWDEASQELTQPEGALGTLAWMPPEQFKDAKNASAASDVYGLGATLYHCLAGRAPFHGQGGALMDQVQNADPPPLRPNNPSLPRDLESICLKCLEKEPRKRYASAKDLADDLRRFLDNKPTVARPVSARERTSKWIRRHPAKAGLYGVSALALAVVMALIGLNLAEGRRADRAFELSVASAISTGEAVDRLEFREPLAEEARRKLAKSAVTILEQFEPRYWNGPEQRSKYAEALLTRGLVNKDLEKGEEAKQDYVKAEGIARDLAAAKGATADHRRLWAKALNRLGTLAFEQCQYQQALDWFVSALALRQEVARSTEASEDDRRDLAVTHMNLGNSYSEMEGKDKEALQEYEASVALFRELVRANPDNAELKHFFARALYNQGEHLTRVAGREQSADDSLKDAWEVWNELGMAEPARTVYRDARGRCLEARGKIQQDRKKTMDATQFYNDAYHEHNSNLMLYPINPKFLAGKARALFGLGRNMAADQKFEVDMQQLGRDQVLAEAEEIFRKLALAFPVGTPYKDLQEEVNTFRRTLDRK